MQENNSTDQLKILGYDSVKNQNNDLSLRNNQLESKLKQATDILREIKLNVERDPNYYIDVDSTLMEDITNLLSEQS